MSEFAIKPEIKLDTDDGDAKLADVEEFEEDTDLQFPPSDLTSWFARIPEELWQSWKTIYDEAPDDAQIEIGKMRVYNGDDNKVELLLKQGTKETQALPQKYTLKITSTSYNNSIVFSEKDLPGHSSKSYGRNRYLTNKPAGINKVDRYNKKSGYTSAIPKQTALAPPIQHEATVSAQIDDADFFTTGMQVPSSNLTKFTLRNDTKNLQPGRSNAVFSSFTTTSKPNNRKKKPKEKAVRMDQQQLYDAIYRCFGQYRYWRLGAFRKELRQPEAYIKATLETVANLVRAGDFAGCWVLKPEYAQMMKIDQSQVKEERANIDSAAEDGTDGGTGDELEDDELGEMEDVKMGGS
ncbi:hypothetical protein AMS68_002591 [Peltaster fructicola]|uniref:Transcription initiation factor IIF subunit beta n=1 Tax=Peltaster fructicola TaxID=286661 RepID=A0A6H0XQR7_9PEZI|nr:hypothetical protein AMS68_002591 [Peltaster fructicola]